ncbi:hypothetical protein M8J75_005354 [Diaphorina citri]|nr:hypothetical protein M8J75_005354 [Diaphorina citri]
MVFLPLTLLPGRTPGGLHAWHAVTEKSMRLGRGARTPDRPVSHASGRDVLTFTRSRGDATTPEEDDEATLRALLIRNEMNYFETRNEMNYFETRNEMNYFETRNEMNYFETRNEMNYFETRNEMNYFETRNEMNYFETRNEMNYFETRN